uniref:Uncharacterized protein n=1 Tax=Cacopsylla melanoneura TaxID=428564 RepID=A0A8D8Q003_9HEMI
MNLSVDFITQNKPFHKNMRIYIILIKYWDQYLFFQEHWSRELLDMEVLVITVFPRQIKVYRLHSYSSEFKMVGVQRKTDYFPSFNTLPNPKIEDYKGRQIVVSTYRCHLFNTLRSMVNFSSAGSIPDLNAYVGIEERIFLEIVSRMNLTWKLRISTNRVVEGSNVVSNKSWKPVMMDLYNGDADMGFCALWNDQAKIHSFDMSAYWSAICLKFLFPRPKKILTNWRNLFEPFNWEIWTLLFSCILLQTAFLMWVSTQALKLKIISTRYYLRPVNSFLEVVDQSVT